MNGRKWITVRCFHSDVGGWGVKALFLRLYLFWSQTERFSLGEEKNKGQTDTARMERRGGRKEGGGRWRWRDRGTEREREGESMYSKCYISIQLLLLPLPPSLPLPPPVLLSPSHSPGSIYNSVGNCWVGFSEGSCCNWFKMQVVSLVMWEEGEDPGPVTRTGGFQTLTFCQIRFWVSGKKKKGFVKKVLLSEI